MPNNLIQEIVVSVVLVILAILFLNPFGFFMFDMMTIAILLVVFSIFSGFVWHEHARDEREAAHAAFGGRVGYLAGAAVLVAGMIAQTFEHRMDYWTVGAFVAMVVAKIATRAWSELRN